MGRVPSRRASRTVSSGSAPCVQYIIRNPFSVEKMHLGPDGTIIYRSGMNPKINANFRIFTPLDFIAAITSHIPDKSFQLVRYYGWYSKKPTNGRRAVPQGCNGAKHSGNMRGQRDKEAAEEAETNNIDGG
ncbi:MAG: hypothetical protein EOL87_15855 [Spartobacteria bacterium]|nr:hypothetical protein [Spartobacteria bacterium]